MNYPLPTTLTVKTTIPVAEYISVPEYHRVQIFALEKQSGLSGFFEEFPPGDRPGRYFLGGMTKKQKIVMAVVIIVFGIAILYFCRKMRRRI